MNLLCAFVSLRENQNQANQKNQFKSRFRQLKNIPQTKLHLPAGDQIGTGGEGIFL